MIILLVIGVILFFIYVVEGTKLLQDRVGEVMMFSWNRDYNSFSDKKKILICAFEIIAWPYILWRVFRRRKNG